MLVTSKKFFAFEIVFDKKYDFCILFIFVFKWKKNEQTNSIVIRSMRKSSGNKKKKNDFRLDHHRYPGDLFERIKQGENNSIIFFSGIM